MNPAEYEVMARVEERVDLATMHPSLRGRLQIPVEPIDVDHLSTVCELVFLCLPHGPAGEMPADHLAGLGLGDEEESPAS